MPHKLLLPRGGGGSSPAFAKCPVEEEATAKPSSSPSSKRLPNMLSGSLRTSCIPVMLVLSRVLASRRALLLSHFGLAEFCVDNGWADSEIGRLDGTKHSDSNETFESFR